MKMQNYVFFLKKHMFFYRLKYDVTLGVEYDVMPEA